MLSDKLLSKTDYNCDREIRTLELLKLRFGDANLHNCEVGILAMPHPSPQWTRHCCVTQNANQSNPGKVAKSMVCSCGGKVLLESTQSVVLQCMCACCAGDAEGHSRQQAHQQQHQGAADCGDQPGEGPAAGRCQHQPPHLHCHLRPLLAPPPPGHPQAAPAGAPAAAPHPCAILPSTPPL